MDGSMTKIGRPTKYRPEFAKQARKLCKLGATNQDLADFFEVDIATIWHWQTNHKPFFSALKVGKEEADERVKRSLFHKATGYSFDTEKIFLRDGKIIRAKTREHVPPSDTACIFWLKNRQPAEWRDKHEIATTTPLEVIHRVIVDPEPKVIEGGEVEVIEQDDAEGHEPGPNATQCATQSASE